MSQTDSVDIKRYEYVDALRGWAILMVMFGHCKLFGTNNYPHFLQSILSYSTMGVPLFFIVSALTLCFSSEKRFQEEPHPIRNFYLRRFFRIAPMFYFSILIYLLVFPPVSIFNLLATFFFFNGFSPYWINSLAPGIWSVTVEMTFYLIFPLLFTVVRRLSTALWFCLVFAVYSTLFTYLLSHFPAIPNTSLWSEYLYYFSPNQISIFLIGFIICLLYTSPSPRDRQKSRMPSSA